MEESVEKNFEERRADVRKFLAQIQADMFRTVKELDCEDPTSVYAEYKLCETISKVEFVITLVDSTKAKEPTPEE